MTAARDLVNTEPNQTVGSLSLGWALKRAALGLLIMAIGCGGAAWLLYASIEPDQADAAVFSSQATLEVSQPAKPR